MTDRFKMAALTIARGSNRAAHRLVSGTSLTVLLLLSSPALAADWYVSAQSAGGSGTKADPLRSIQQAVNRAAAGDTVHVAAGLYLESVMIEGKRLTLLGGYTPDFNSRDPWTHVTTVQAGSGDVITVSESGASVIDGLRLTGGSRGILLTLGEPTVRNCLIEDNHAPYEPYPRGGGVYANQANALVERNIIRNNSAIRGGGVAADRAERMVLAANRIENNTGIGDHGGGVYLGITESIIIGNVIANNRVGAPEGFGWGGGVLIYNPGNTAYLSYNIITGNFAPTIGSGVFIDEGATAYLEHELIYANRCPHDGGAAFYIDGGAGTSRATLRNCTIANHQCPNVANGGNAIYVDPEAEATVENSILWGNIDDFMLTPGSSLTVRYTLSQEPISGEGNFQADPLFADPAAGDFHVRSQAGRWSNGQWVIDDVTSPAIDVGDPAVTCPSEPAPNGGRLNLGAYGDTAEASLSPSSTHCGPDAGTGGSGAFFDGGGDLDSAIDSPITSDVDACSSGACGGGGGEIDGSFGGQDAAAGTGGDEEPSGGLNTGASNPDNSCGCWLAGRVRTSQGWLLTLAVALGWWVRRRRRS